MDILPIQNDQPSLVFFFGAGASYADGVPVQSGLIPKILNSSDPQILKSQPAKRVRRFLKENFSSAVFFPSLEEVYSYIDYFIANSIHLNNSVGPSELFQIKNDLTKLLHYLISSATDTSTNYREFWKKVKSINQGIGVISTNYDTLLDETFDSIYPNCLIDYCLDLVNHRTNHAIDPFNWWIDPKKPGMFFTEEHPTRIKLLKLHGSLNWKFCDCCGQVTLTPWQHSFNLKTDSFQSFLGIDTVSCPFDKTRLTSLLQLPSHNKSTTNHIFNRLQDEALYMIRSANHVVFVGYSFPEADVHIRALVRRGFDHNGKITIVNKSPKANLLHRYASCAINLEYIEDSFENFVFSSKLDTILHDSGVGLTNRSTRTLPL